MKYLSIAFCIIILSLSACDVDNENVPNNVIVSDSGITIDLEWDTGGSVNQAIGEVDLDMGLFLGNTEVDFASSQNTFEQVFIEPFFVDGIYIVEVIYFDGIADADFRTFVRGTGAIDNKVFESRVRLEEVGTAFDYLEIEKTGNRYRIIVL